MKKIKRMLAATLALTVLFATNVMAQTPREILSQAYANSVDVTTMAMSGNISGTVNIMGSEVTLDMDIDISVDMDIDAGTMMMYMRMPMTISGTDPMTGESIDENIEVALFMDGTTVFVYESSIGWFTDPSIDMALAAEMDDVFAVMDDIEELMAWALELNELIMDEITIQFADDQVDGYYVIEQFMDWDDMVNMLDMIFTPEFFEVMTAFVPEEDMVDFDLAMLEIDELMDELMALLGEVDIELEMAYRSYIDAETLSFHRYYMDAALTFAFDLDLGIMGNIPVSGDFAIDFMFDYNPTIVWPVIDNVASLDDILETISGSIEVAELTFGTDDLEERIALVFDGDATMAVIAVAIEANANFNVFIVNHGDEAVSIDLPGVFSEVLQAGQGFVMQIPAGTLDGGTAVVIESAVAPLDVEVGFRLTEYPLS